MLRSPAAAEAQAIDDHPATHEEARGIMCEAFCRAGL